MNHFRYEDIYVGMSESFSVEITSSMLDGFKTITGDNNSLHCNEKFAVENGWGGVVVYGMLTASFLSTLAGVYLPGENSLIQSVDIQFAKPVFVGDKLTVSGTVKEKDDKFRYFVLKVEIRNQSGIKVLRGKMQIGFSH